MNFVKWPNFDDWRRPIRVGKVVLTALCLGGCYLVPQAEKQSADAPLSENQLLSTAALGQSGQPGSILAKSIGTSMEPVYRAGTLFLIQPTKWEDLKTGDVIAYRNPSGQIIVHRLIHSYGNRWLAQGDNNLAPDQAMVTPQNLVGVVETSFLPPHEADDP